jgi:hypothetical protein
MKQQNEVNTKAGTLKRRIGIINMYDRISKIASMLLIVLAGFGTMSFTQDDDAVNNIDTNLSVKKETVIATTSAIAACCGETAAKPGDDIKTAFYISLPNTKAFVKADREAINRFYIELKARQCWSMDIAQAVKQADAEMYFNFKVSNINLLAAAGFDADAEMINNFIKTIILQSVNFSQYAQYADNEMIDNFITAHFSIKNIQPFELFIAEADAAIINAFEKANLPFINLPSKIAAHNADLEMIQQYRVELKNIQTLVQNN